MTEQHALNMRRTLRAIGRRWRPLVGLLAGGVAAGLLVTVLEPTVFEARSGVLFPPSAVDDRGNALRDMRTEAHVATSVEILERAGRALDPPVTAEMLRRRIEVQALSSDILEVRAEDNSAAGAVSAADTVAREYVAYSNSATSVEADTTIALLQEQAAELDQRIRRLAAEIAASTARLVGIDPRSAEALRLTAQIDSLRSEEVDASRELSTINNRMAEARLNAQLSRRGTRVLEATTPEDPSRPRPAWNLGVGGLAGLIAGALVALGLDQGNPRLRRRDELADAAGAPVLASLRVPRRSSARKCRALLEGWKPSVAENLALQQAFRQLGTAEDEPTRTIVVVVLPGDRRSTLLAIHLAAFAAITGRATSFVVASQHRTVSSLRRACAARAGPGETIRPNLRIYGATSVPEQDLQPSDLTIVVLVAEPGPLVVPTGNGQTATVLGVSSGFPTPETLGSVAAACLDAGYPAIGILVANADAGDPTTGRLSVRSAPSAERRRDAETLSSPVFPS